MKKDNAGSDAEDRAPPGADLVPAQRSSLEGPAGGQIGQLDVLGQIAALRAKVSAHSDHFSYVAYDVDIWMQAVSSS